MTIEALLEVVAGELNAAGVPFMLTGSIAAACHGAGRATMDIDLVVDPGVATLDDFVRRIEARGLYVSADAARAALESRSMFTIVDTRTGWKADLIVRKNRPFSEAEFARRTPVQLRGVTVDVATMEDVLLSKLEWARLGGSARQIEDVRALLRLHGDEIDRSYVERWVDSPGLSVQWQDAIRGPAA